MNVNPVVGMAMKHRAGLNRVWSSLILDELSRLGVEHVCIAPGSRSTPLTLSATERDSFTIHTHFDERGLGFLALGLAKASQQPVVIIVTSGTAVANLLPAIAEANLTGEKLVVLTSDRPVELMACGANQAIEQRGIFSHHVTAFCDLPSPSLSIPPEWVLTTIDEAMAQQSLKGGAVHINCQYPEPLYGIDGDFSLYLSSLVDWQSDDEPYCVRYYPSNKAIADIFDVKKWAALTQKKGVIIVGRLNHGELAGLTELANTLGWPLLVDPQAGGNSPYSGFDAWLQNPACASLLSQSEVILQFGGRLVSKRLLQWISDHRESEYWLVDPLCGRLDPTHRRSTRIQADCLAWAMYALSLVEHSTQFEWAKSLMSAVTEYYDVVATHSQTLTELSLASHLATWLLPTTELFIGNSTMVRLLDICGQLNHVRTFANRGASGIDGLIATAAGVQRARQIPLVVVLGDTSLLYDLNSLALLRQHEYPIVVIVTNNNGGGIFDLLPVPNQQKDDYYRMPHHLSFSHAAAMFDLTYHLPSTLAEAQSCLLSAQQHCGTSLVEITTPEGEAGEMLTALFQEIHHATLL